MCLWWGGSRRHCVCGGEGVGVIVFVVGQEADVIVFVWGGSRRHCVCGGAGGRRHCVCGGAGGRRHCVCGGGE